MLGLKAEKNKKRTHPVTNEKSSVKIILHNLTSGHYPKKRGAI
jgi:hypothetical protein